MGQGSIGDQYGIRMRQMRDNLAADFSTNFNPGIVRQPECTLPRQAQVVILEKSFVSLAIMQNLVL